MCRKARLQITSLSVDVGSRVPDVSAVLQFYRVEVKVLPPEKAGQARTRSVLRRFSHFLKLHGKVGAGFLAQNLDPSSCILYSICPAVGRHQHCHPSGRACTHSVQSH